MPIDIALLGCADAALADVLGVIVSEPDVRLAAVWDSDRARIPAPVRDYAVADAETAIARAAAVIVSAPIAERPVLCARAARAGRPALVEVPLAASAALAAGLVGELHRHRTPVLAALPLRELDALGRLAATLRAGVLGRVSGVEALLTRAATTDEPRPEAGPGRRRPTRRHGFVELAVHLLDALASLGETPRLDAVSLDRRSGGGDRGGAALGRWGGAPLVVRTSAGCARLGGPARAGRRAHERHRQRRRAGTAQRWRFAGPLDRRPAGSRRARPRVPGPAALARVPARSARRPGPRPGDRRARPAALADRRYSVPGGQPSEPAAGTVSPGAPATARA